MQIGIAAIRGPTAKLTDIKEHDIDFQRIHHVPVFAFRETTRTFLSQILPASPRFERAVNRKGKKKPFSLRWLSTGRKKISSRVLRPNVLMQ